jgi:hypothetical protein
MVHKISEATMRLAQLHGTQVYKHGKLVESYALALLKGEESKDAQLNTLVDSIREDGRLIQNHARNLLSYSQLLQKQDGYSTNLYAQAVLEHVKATQMHIRATRTFTSFIQDKLDAFKKMST